MKLLVVGAGGALGSVLRFLLEGWLQRAVAGTFPVGVLAVNALGSFAIGFVMTLLEARGALDTSLRLALVTGLLGGFTTYSTFNYQTLELFRAGSWATGAANLAGTVLLCLAGGLAGLAAGRWVVG